MMSTAPLATKWMKGYPPSRSGLLDIHAHMEWDIATVRGEVGHARTNKTRPCVPWHLHFLHR